MGTSRHSPGNRAALEAALPDWLPLIADRCSSWNIEFRLWPHIREIAAPAQSEAWDRMTTRLMNTGMSRDAAEREAAERLELELTMLRARRDRAKYAAARAIS